MRELGRVVASQPFVRTKQFVELYGPPPKKARKGDGK